MSGPAAVGRGEQLPMNGYGPRWPHCTGIFDPAAVLEMAVDSGIWLAPDHRPLTRDGPHPDALAATMAAKAVTVAELLQ
jgi:hypothetical protein